MALYPHARQLLLPESNTQPRITPRVMIFHSAAGTGSLYRFFLNGSSLESHFWIGLDGTVEQYVDTDVRADANYKANPFAISVETENSRDGVRKKAWDTDPWTPEQIDAAIALGDWAARVHPIERQQCPTWDGTGFGWHIQFGTPGKWTPVAKACPGRKRIDQFKAEILPGIVAMRHPQPPEGFLMALTDDQQKKLYDEVMGTSMRVAKLEKIVDDTDGASKGTIFGRIRDGVARIEAKLK